MDQTTRVTTATRAADNRNGEAPCWSRIGVDGDSTCPELAAAIHCRNCHVYSEAGRGLLDREIPAEYRDEWSDRLAVAKEGYESGTDSAVVFSLGMEHLALPTAIFVEVTDARGVRRLPGADNPHLLGLVNIRGEIQLCIGLHSLLGIDAAAGEAAGTGPETGSHPPEKFIPGATGRLLVVHHAGESWVFPVVKVHGTVRYSMDRLTPPPATVDKSLARFSRGTMEWEGKTVGFLDEKAVFAALKGSMA